MSDVVVSWREYGCFGPPGPWTEETYQNERSAAEALLAKPWDRSRAYYANGKSVTRAQVEHSVEFYENRDRQRVAQAAYAQAERVKLETARREAVLEVLRRVKYRPGAMTLETADEVIAAYEGVKT